MHLSSAFILGIHISSIIANPTQFNRYQFKRASHVSLPLNADINSLANMAEPEPNKIEPRLEPTGTMKPVLVTRAAAMVGSEEGGEADEAPEDEIEADFGEIVALDGDDIKQDTLFPQSAIGRFEFEFKSKTADELTVTENKTPAAAPAGFEHIEPSSFQVALGVSRGVGLTLAKIDYMFDIGNVAFAGKDLSQSKVGRLNTDTSSFVIDETIGSLKFEADEGEISLVLNSDVVAEGEWGIFLPVAIARRE
ncbi:hypothetical protein LZ554_004585 [Drepanopeziza brunnea f. sp. 'monogermtubi']|nr:hypothetical protein LZ554_004585 [Drepanopeziza brunnea f. sp. 'monogermtubi']